MAYAPPASSAAQRVEKDNKVNLQPHPSLPARPPPSASSPPPFRNNNPNPRPYANNGAAAFGGFAPRSVVSRAPTISAAPTHGPSVMTSQAPVNAGGYQSSTYQQQHTSYYQQPSIYATQTPPQIVNPFPLPGQANRGYGRDGAYDPETEAQIAEWNSAYAPRDDSNKKTGQNGPTPARDANVDSEAGTGAGTAGEKQKTVVRQGGGKQWQDQSLLEWDPTHPRLFIGNLAGEVTDESLLKAFARYPSVTKARVVREKRTTKSKGYGFVAFTNTDDFFAAAKEMQGKYIGSHPVTVKRATTEIVASAQPDKKHGKNGRNNKRGGGDGGGGGGKGAGAGGNYAGVQKWSQQKRDKSGPKMLG